MTTPNFAEFEHGTSSALIRAQAIGERAGQEGFDWPDALGPLSKLDEELAELRAAIASGDQAHIESEVGDLLFSLVNLARHLGVDAERALNGTSHRFVSRLTYVQMALSKRGLSIRDVSAAEVDALWQEAKTS